MTTGTTAGRAVARTTGTDAAKDRQRARTARGLAGARPGAVGDRLPAPPRERRPAAVALAVLLVVGGAAGAGLLAVRLDERVPVLVAARDLPVGTQLQRADFAEAPVAAEGLDLLPASQVDQLVGRYTSVAVPAGRLMDPAMLTDSSLFGDGDAAVGMVLEPGRMPASGLSPGDVVAVVRVVDGEPTVLTDEAVVSRADSASAAEPGSFVGGGAPSGAVGATTVTLVVSPEAYPDVAAASVEGSAAVVLLRRGG